MKRMMFIIMFVLFVLPLLGCNNASEVEIISPCNFYYHNDLDSKENFNDVFICEIREKSHYADDLVQLLNDYFTGPQTENLVNPYPAGLTVISVYTEQDTTYIMLNDHISTLSGIDLTMAYTCLSLTLFDLTDCEYVEISAEKGLPANQDSVLFEKSMVIFTDNTQLPNNAE